MYYKMQKFSFHFFKDLYTDGQNDPVHIDPQKGLKCYIMFARPVVGNITL